MLKALPPDEGVKKKKHRILILLVALFIVIGALPLASSLPPAATPTAFEVAAASPTTTLTAVGATSVSPTATSTRPAPIVTSAPTATIAPTATPPTPTATESEGGAGGSPPIAIVTPTLTPDPTDTPAPSATPTPTPLGALPITGAEPRTESSGALGGLVAMLLGLFLLGAGVALHQTRLKVQRAPRQRAYQFGMRITQKRRDITIPRHSSPQERRPPVRHGVWYD